MYYKSAKGKGLRSMHYTSEQNSSENMYKNNFNGNLMQLPTQSIKWLSELGKDSYLDFVENKQRESKYEIAVGMTWMGCQQDRYGGHNSPKAMRTQSGIKASFSIGSQFGLAGIKNQLAGFQNHSFPQIIINQQNQLFTLSLTFQIQNSIDHINNSILLDQASQQQKLQQEQNQMAVMFIESSSTPTPQNVGLNQNSNPPTSGYFVSFIQHQYLSELEYFPHRIKFEIGRDKTLSLKAIALDASKGDLAFEIIVKKELPGLKQIENLSMAQLCVLVYESVIINGKNIGYLQLQATALMIDCCLLTCNLTPDDLNTYFKTLNNSPPSPIPILPNIPSQCCFMPFGILYQYLACLPTSLISYFLFLLRKID